MVLGIGALASLGLALPTGMAFGYGYGYGVRQGYSAFKPPSKTANDLKLSPNPVAGALGAGLQSGEERTDVKTPVGTLTPEPSLMAQSSRVVGGGTNASALADAGMVQNKAGQWRLKSSFKSHEEFITWMNKTTTNYKRKRIAHR